MEMTYNISGMTCETCAQIVSNALLNVEGVEAVDVDLSKAQALIKTDYNLVLETLQTALADTLYQISEVDSRSTMKPDPVTSDQLSEKNKALISGYVTAVGKLDHSKLHLYLHPDFEFNGMVKFHSAKDYIQMIREHANSSVSEILVKNDIKAIFADEEECCVIYDSVSCFPGITVPFVELIKIKDNKIISTDVKFNRHDMKLLMQKISQK